MALVKCINCGKEISDKVEKCIHCNTKILKEKNISTNNSYGLDLLNRYLINTILTLIFIFMMYYMATFNYRIDYTFMEFINSKIFHGDWYTIIQIFIWGYLIICLWFTGLNKVTNILAKIFYVFMILGEILFGLVVLEGTTYEVLTAYWVMVTYSVIWIIYLFITNGKFKKSEFKKKKKESNTLDELNKAKELFDNKVISEEEFNKIKANILKDYMD